MVVHTGELDESLAVRVDDVLAGHLGQRGTGAAHRFGFERLDGLLGRLDRLEHERAEAEVREPSADPIVNLDPCALEVVVVGRSGVPAIEPATLREGGGMLHERHALAFDRVCYQRLGPIVQPAELVEDRAQRRMVVTVTRRYVPAEGPQLGLEVAEREDLLGRFVRLELVAIDDDQ